MEQGRAWLRGGVLLTVLTGGFAMPPPEPPPEVIGCSFPQRVLVFGRSIRAGDPVSDAGIGGAWVDEEEMPIDAFDIAELELMLLREEAEGVPVIAGIDLVEGEFVRKGWLMQRIPSVFDGLE